MDWVFLILAGIFEMFGVLMINKLYAVWTGIGASGGAILGMIFYGEPRNILRFCS